MTSAVECDWFAYEEAAVTDWNQFNSGVIEEFRRTGGSVGGRFKGAPMILVTHRGAKSGKSYTTPLVYTRDGDDVILVASQGGSLKTPSWVFNLRANPEATIQIGSEKLEVVAREASDEERKRLWPMVVDTYADYAVYQSRTKRKIPLIVLSPAD